MKIDWRRATGDFESAAERDKWVIAHANLFTVVRYLGPGHGYERHEVKNLLEAVALAKHMADMVDRIYLIYAVAGNQDCFVRSVHPTKQ